MNAAEKFAVILPAAGTGSRFGGGDKLLVELAGKAVLCRSIELFARRADVQAIVVVTGAERIEVYKEMASRADLRGIALSFVVGGAHRWESVLNGLRSLVAMAPAFVAVHDAARPLCPTGVIDAAFAATRAAGAGLPCVAEPATLKRRDDAGNVRETVERAGLFQAQTPQCFEFRALLEGYERLVTEGRVSDLTDDAQVFERMGRAVPMTAGSPQNIKITTADDLILARAILAQSQDA